MGDASAAAKYTMRGWEQGFRTLEVPHALRQMPSNRKPGVAGRHVRSITWIRRRPACPEQASRGQKMAHRYRLAIDSATL